MATHTEYRDFLKAARSRLGYWKSYSLLQFTVSLTRILRSDRVSGKKLAKRLGLSAQQVSKVLSGNENITVETMAKFAAAVDAVVHIHVAKKGVPVQWIELGDEVRLPTSTGAFDSSPLMLRSRAGADISYLKTVN